VATQLDIRTSLAKRVLDAIAAGAPPWRSVHNRGVPTNPQTGRKFTGINPLILDAVADKNKFRSKYWATYHQWHLQGMQVPRRKPDSELGINIVKWQPFTKTVDKGDIISLERFSLLQTYAVFNADQCFGKDCGKFLILNENKQEPDYSHVESIIEATRADIRHHPRVKRPRYDRPPDDRIMLPPRSRFIDDAQYYATKVHEILHWAEWRIGWTGSADMGELIAEIGTGYLESELGLPHDQDMTNHNKWVGIWVANIESNPKYLFDAAAQAARAVDYVLGFTRVQEREDSDLQPNSSVVQSRHEGESQ
jgi:antirestriction protein ArdC